MQLYSTCSLYYYSEGILLLTGHVSTENTNKSETLHYHCGRVQCRDTSDFWWCVSCYFQLNNLFCCDWINVWKSLKMFDAYRARCECHMVVKRSFNVKEEYWGTRVDDCRSCLLMLLGQFLWPWSLIEVLKTIIGGHHRVRRNVY